MEHLNTETGSNKIVITEGSDEITQKFTPDISDQKIQAATLKIWEATQNKMEKSLIPTSSPTPILALLEPVGVVFSNGEKRCIKKFDEGFKFEYNKNFYSKCKDNNWEPVFKFNKPRFEQLAEKALQVDPTFLLLKRYFDTVDEDNMMFALNSRMLKELAYKTRRVKKGILSRRTDSLIAFIVETILNRWNLKPRRMEESVRPVKHTVTEKTQALRNVSCVLNSGLTERDWVFDAKKRCLPMLQTNFVVKMNEHEDCEEIPDNCVKYFKPIEDLYYEPTLQMLLEQEKQEMQNSIQNNGVILRTIPANEEKEDEKKDEDNGEVNDKNENNEVIDKKDEDNGEGDENDDETVSNELQRSNSLVPFGSTVDASNLPRAHSLAVSEFDDNSDPLGDNNNLDFLLANGDFSRNDSLDLFENTLGETTFNHEGGTTFANKIAHIERINTEHESQLHDDTDAFSAAVEHDADGATTNSKSVSETERAVGKSTVRKKSTVGKKRKRNRNIETKSSSVRRSGRKRTKRTYYHDETYN